MMKEHYDRVWAQIELDNVNHNIDEIEKKVSSDHKIICVIKADGYGHGALPIAKELEKHERVFGYAVATAEEALMLRDNSIRKPIIIIGYSFPGSYDEMIARDVRLTVFRKDMVDEIDAIAGRFGLIAKVHVAVDTGMSRIGVMPDESGVDFIKYVLSKENISIEGIFTHFARADEEDLANAYGQLEVFHAFVKRCQDELGYKFPVVHLANSAGIIEIPESYDSCVRAGIILYGMWPSKEVNHESLTLKPLLSLKSQITFVKEVGPRVPVSYGGIYVTDKKTRIATVPVGYADGYTRALSNKGYVLIHGKKAKILGRICMDQFMCDVTDIPDVKEGDVVTLIGSEGGETITMEDLSEWSGQLNYELACIIGKRVPRIYTRGGTPVYSRDFFVDVPLKSME